MFPRRANTTQGQLSADLRDSDAIGCDTSEIKAELWYKQS